MSDSELENWAAAERLRAIERAAWWRGFVQRQDVAEIFGVSLAQTSTDFQAYQVLNPGALNYNLSAKRYESSESMNCVLHKPRLAEAVSQYLGGPAPTALPGVVPVAEIEDGAGGEDADARFGVLQLPRRRADPVVERLLFLAIYQGLSIRGRYLSVGSGRSRWRLLAPHAVAHDGWRWHVRAWCFDREDYRDFVIGRFESVAWPLRLQEHTDIELPRDEDWETFVTVKVKPNESLEPSARKALRMDYGLEGKQVLAMRTRKAMLRYLLEALRLPMPGAGEEGGKIDAVLPRHFDLVGIGS
jgi:hypothetical protein